MGSSCCGGLWDHNHERLGSGIMLTPRECTLWERKDVPRGRVCAVVLLKRRPDFKHASICEGIELIPKKERNFIQGSGDFQKCLTTTIVLGFSILFTWLHGNILGSGKKKDALSAIIIYIQTNKQTAIAQEDDNARNWHLPSSPFISAMHSWSGDCDIEYCQVGFPLINEKQAESTKD